MKIAFRSTDIVPRRDADRGRGANRLPEGASRNDQGDHRRARQGRAIHHAAHRDESAQILAKAYKIDPAVAKSAIDNCLDTDPRYWSTGRFDYTSMDEVVKGLVLIKASGAGPVRLACDRRRVDAARQRAHQVRPVRYDSPALVRRAGEQRRASRVRPFTRRSPTSRGSMPPTMASRPSTRSGRSA